MKRKLSNIVKLKGYKADFYKCLENSDLGLISSRWKDGLVSIEMISSDHHCVYLK